MIYSRIFSFLIIAFGLCASAAQGQESSSKSPEPKKPDAALREKAFSLLESLAEQLSILQSSENRARIGSNIVGSLWDHDEKRARAVLALVESDLKAVLQNPAGDDPTDQHTFMVFLTLRMNTIERLAQHDPETALNFLKATEPVSEKGLPYETTGDQRSFELRLARQVERQNPELALKLGRESLAKGYSNDLLQLLRQMLKNHQDQGAVLYKEAVAKVTTVNLEDNWSAWNFASSLAQSFKPPTINAASYRDLLTVILTRALAAGCDKKEHESAEVCWQVGPLVKHMEQIDPARASKLVSWSRESPVEDFSNVIDELNDVMESGTVDELLALARKNPQMAKMICWQAIVKAVISGDYDRAKKIADEYPNPEERDHLLKRLETFKDWASLSDEKIAEIQETLKTMRTNQDRIQYLITMANRIGAKNSKASVKLLDQANEIVNTMRVDKEQTGSQIELAAMYSLEKNERGFQIIEGLVPKLNELVNAASKLDGYDNRYLREGEWNMTAEGGVGDLLTRLAQNAGYFAWLDFDRAVTLTGQFERPEIRMMAQLKLAQGILAGPRARMPVVLPVFN